MSRSLACVESASPNYTRLGKVARQPNTTSTTPLSPPYIPLLLYDAIGIVNRLDLIYLVFAIASFSLKFVFAFDLLSLNFVITERSSKIIAIIFEWKKAAYIRYFALMRKLVLNFCRVKGALGKIGVPPAKKNLRKSRKFVE